MLHRLSPFSRRNVVVSSWEMQMILSTGYHHPAEFIKTLLRYFMAD